MEQDDINCLTGLFVSDIFAWEYQDSVRYDSEHQTNYSTRWIQRAKSKDSSILFKSLDSAKKRLKWKKYLRTFATTILLPWKAMVGMSIDIILETFVLQ